MAKKEKTITLTLEQLQKLIADEVKKQAQVNPYALAGKNHPIDPKDLPGTPPLYTEAEMKAINDKVNADAAFKTPQDIEQEIAQLYR
jgi:hypothetical protein